MHCFTYQPLSPVTQKLTVHDATFTNSYDIANIFNFYFANVGKTLASGLADQLDNTYLSYLKNLCQSSIFIFI